MAPISSLARRTALVLALAIAASACTAPAGAVPAGSGLDGATATAGSTAAASATPRPTVAATPVPTPIVAQPDERWILFSLFIKNDQKAPFLVRPDGTDRHRILGDVLGDLRAPSWAPDGQSILFVVRNNDTPDGSIWTAGANGEDPHMLFDGGDDCDSAFYPAWSPDQTRIAFVCYGPGYKSALALLDPVTLEVTRLTEVLGPQTLDNPSRWSADGKTLAYDILRFDPTDTFIDGSLLATIDAVAGAKPSLLTDFTSMAAHPDWNPDGRGLVYNTYDLGNIGQTGKPSNLYSIDLATRAITPVTTASVDGSFRIAQPRWDPDLNRIWVTTARDAIGVRLGWVDPGTGEVTELHFPGARPEPRP